MRQFEVCGTFEARMLRNIIIIGSSSGLVLFSKVFANGILQPRLVGSLITAIIEFGQQTTGMGVCYIELSNVSITMVANDDAKVVCALFYDRDDGVTFGRLICSEILNAFTQEYSSDATQFGKNLKDFYGFTKKIGHIVRFSSKSVILKLESHKAIKRVLLMNEREIIHTPNDDIDQLSILANLTAFTELCSSIMSSINDSVQHVSLHTGCHHTIHMWRVQEHSILVVAVDSKAPREEYFPHIEEALEIIEQVCILYTTLEQSAR